MSQGGALSSSGSSGGTPVETITGNTGGPITPSAGFNFNLVANTTMGITTVGTEALNQINIIGIQSTTSQIGVVELASSAQAIAGTDANNAVTSAALAAKLGTQTQFGLPIGAGSTAAITWTADPSNGQILIGSSGVTPVLSTLTAGPGITIANGAGSITISGSSSSVKTYTAVNHAASPYTVLSTDEYLGVTTTGGAVTILLPNAPATGTFWTIKDTGGDSATNNITVTTVGGAIDIDGALTFVIKTNYEAVDFIFNGATYEAF